MIKKLYNVIKLIVCIVCITFLLIQTYSSIIYSKIDIEEFIVSFNREKLFRIDFESFSNSWIYIVEGKEKNGYISEIHVKYVRKEFFRYREEAMYILHDYNQYRLKNFQMQKKSCLNKKFSKCYFNPQFANPYYTKWIQETSLFIPQLTVINASFEVTEKMTLSELKKSMEKDNNLKLYYGERNYEENNYKEN